MDADENTIPVKKQKSSSRRSSILKKRHSPVTDNNDSSDKEGAVRSKGRRVSFCDTFLVKEFPKDSPRNWSDETDVYSGGADNEVTNIQLKKRGSALQELSSINSLLTGQINHNLQLAELTSCGVHYTDYAVGFQDPEPRKCLRDVTGGALNEEHRTVCEVDGDGNTVKLTGSQNRSIVSEKNYDGGEETTTKVFEDDFLDLTNVVGGIVNSSEKSFLASDNNHTRVFDASMAQMELTQCHYTYTHMTEDGNIGGVPQSAVLSDSSNKIDAKAFLRSIELDSRDSQGMSLPSRSFGLDTPDKIDAKQFLRSLMMSDNDRQSSNLKDEQQKAKPEESYRELLPNSFKNGPRSDTTGDSNSSSCVLSGLTTMNMQVVASSSGKVADNSIVFDGDDAEMSLTDVISLSDGVPSMDSHNRPSVAKPVASDHLDKTIFLKGSEANMSLTCMLPPSILSQLDMKSTVNSRNLLMNKPLAVRDEVNTSCITVVPSGASCGQGGSLPSFKRQLPCHSTDREMHASKSGETASDKTIFLKGDEADMSFTSVVPSKMMSERVHTVDTKSGEMVSDKTIFLKGDEADMSFTSVMPSRVSSEAVHADDMKSGETVSDQTIFLKGDEADMSFTSVMPSKMMSERVHTADKKSGETASDKTIFLKGDEADMSFTSVVPSKVISDDVKRKTLNNQTVVLKENESNLSSTCVLPSDSLPKQKDVDTIKLKTVTGQHVSDKNLIFKECEGSTSFTSAVPFSGGFPVVLPSGALPDLPATGLQQVGAVVVSEADETHQSGAEPRMDESAENLEQNKAEFVTVRSEPPVDSATTSPTIHTADNITGCQSTNKTVIFNETCGMEFTNIQPDKIQSANKTIVIDKTLSEMELTEVQPSGASITSKELRRSGILSTLKTRFTRRSSLYKGESLMESRPDSEQDQNAFSQQDPKPSQLVSQPPASTPLATSQQHLAFVQETNQSVAVSLPLSSSAIQSHGSASSQYASSSQPVSGSCEQSVHYVQSGPKELLSASVSAASHSAQVTQAALATSEMGQSEYVKKPSAAVSTLQSCAESSDEVDYLLSSLPMRDDQTEGAENGVTHQTDESPHSQSSLVSETAAVPQNTCADSGRHEREMITPENAGAHPASSTTAIKRADISTVYCEENISRLELTSHCNQSLVTCHSSNISISMGPCMLKDRTLSLESVPSNDDIPEGMASLSSISLPNLSVDMDIMKPEQENEKALGAPVKNNIQGDPTLNQKVDSDTGSSVPTHPCADSESSRVDCPSMKASLNSSCFFGDWSQIMANSQDDILAPECDVETVDDYLSMFGITMLHKNCSRSSLTTVDVIQPQTLSEYLELRLVKTELEIKKSGSLQLSCLIERFKELTSDKEKEIQQNLPEMVKKASANFMDYFEKVQGLSTACLKKAKKYLKEWKLKQMEEMQNVHKAELSLLEDAKKQLTNKHQCVNEAIDKMRKCILEFEEVQSARKQLQQEEKVLRDKQKRLLEKENELKKLKEKQHLMEEHISQQHAEEELQKTVQSVREHTARMLRCLSYTFQHLSENHIVLSFLSGSFILDITLGDVISENGSDNSPVRHIKNVSIETKIKGEQFNRRFLREIHTTNLTKFGVELMKGSVTEKDMCKACTDTQQLRKMLLELSVVATEVEHWMKYLRFIAVKHPVRYNGSSVTIEFCSTDAEAAFEVTFEIDVLHFISSSPKVTVKRIFGKVEPDDIIPYLSSVEPGPDFIKTAVRVLHSNVLHTDTELY